MSNGAEEKEFLVWGPPGSGKTTFLAAQATNAAKKYGSDNVMVCSLTKAAATEAAGRDTCVSKSMIGTLHALCYRALGSPKMAESAEGIDLWNSENKFAQLHPGKNAGDVDNLGPEEYFMRAKLARSDLRFDAYLMQANLLRARKAAKIFWTSRVLGFYSRWEAFKQKHDLLDFADLIDRGSDLLYAPGNPNVIFIDEAQDLSCAEHELVQKWSRRTEKVVIIADRDQSLYYWRGSSERIADPLRFPKERIRSLEQSYRVPKAVHAAAVKLIRKHSDRVDLPYYPTEEEGLVRRSSATVHDPRGVLKIIERALVANKTVMVLASCGYMLREVERFLRIAGVPFGNKYIRSKKQSALSRSASQVYDYLKISKEFTENPEFWSPREVRNIVHSTTKTRLFRRGRGALFDRIADDLTSEELALILRANILPAELKSFMKGDPELYLDYFSGIKKDRMTYPVAVARKFGREVLKVEPPVTVGTIHSVKGGEADVVILFPDISAQGGRQYQARGFGGKDAVIRLFYVGMTRAREELVLCAPGGHGHYAKEIFS